MQPQTSPAPINNQTPFHGHSGTDGEQEKGVRAWNFPQPPKLETEFSREQFSDSISSISLYS